MRRRGDGTASNRHFTGDGERGLLPRMDQPVALAPLADVRKEHVLRMLAAFGHKQGETARALGIDRKTLSRWLVRWNYPET